MRLIDADALINELNNSHYPGAPYIDAGISIAIGKVCDAPTIEPQSQRTGRWINDHCSECGQYVWYGDMRKYCPNCGARMDGEIEAWNRRGMNG